MPTQQHHDSSVIKDIRVGFRAFAICGFMWFLAGIDHCIVNIVDFSMLWRAFPKHVQPLSYCIDLSLRDEEMRLVKLWTVTSRSSMFLVEVAIKTHMNNGPLFLCQWSTVSRFNFKTELFTFPSARCLRQKHLKSMQDIDLGVGGRTSSRLYHRRSEWPSHGISRNTYLHLNTNYCGEARTTELCW